MIENNDDDPTAADLNNPTLTPAQVKNRDRSKIRGLFSENPAIRADAVEAMKKAWAFDAPSFDIAELATQPADNCTIMAARRDGQKEVLTWLMKL